MNKTRQSKPQVPAASSTPNKTKLNAIQTKIKSSAEGRNRRPAGAVKPTQRARQPLRRPAVKTSSKPNQASVNFKGPDKKHGKTSEQIQSRLKKKSPWYQSIDDPITGAGAKIPDVIGTETGTLQTIQEFPVAVNANGVCGFKITTPYPNAVSVSPPGASSNTLETSSTSTAAALGWQGARALDAATTLNANTQGVRIVSACVIASPEVATLSDQGEMCAFVTPFDFTASTAAYTDLVKQYDSSTIPVNAHKPMKASWYPTCMTDEVGYAYDYRSFVHPNDTATIPLPYWEFGVVATGMAASAGNIKFKVIVNYEFIPLFNVLELVDSAPSPQDPVEEQLVESWIQDLPTTGAISPAAASRSGASVVDKVPEDQTFGFGMLFDVISEIAPLALALL